MKHPIVSVPALIAGVFVSLILHGQDCKTFFLLKEGNEIGTAFYDKKGEANGRSVSTVNTVRQNGGSLEARLNSKVYSDKGKELASNADVTVTCTNGAYAVDVRNLIPGESMASLNGMQVRVTGNMAEYPAVLNPGMTLNDADVMAEPTSGGVALRKMTVTLKIRKVEGKESVASPVGTFDCYKITYDANLKMGIGVNYQASEWVAPGFGVVKSETYRNGKLAGSTLLPRVTPKQ